MLKFIRIFTFFLIAITALYLLVLQPQSRQAEQEVAIGGAFTLHNQTGETITNESLKGKPRLVYFGYTYCPDICPTALVAMQQAAKNIGTDTIAQVFVTVDPARDTPEHLKEYAANFPNLIALTGSMEEVKEAARVYKIYYQKAAASADDENYLVDHSSFIYLMDAEGKYLAHFPHDINAQKLEAAVRAAL
jgi:protein SCO1/2